MIRYKLTDQDCRTHGGFQWEPDVWREATGVGNQQCTDGVLHYYDSPRIAVLLNPGHARIAGPVLWELETDKELGHDGVKGWCKRARITLRLPLPELTTEQRIIFAIRAAMLVCFYPPWVKWAAGWLNGTDRTLESAYAALGGVMNPATCDAAEAAIHANDEMAALAANDVALGTWRGDVPAIRYQLNKIAEEL